MLSVMARSVDLAPCNSGIFRWASMSHPPCAISQACFRTKVRLPQRPHIHVSRTIPPRLVEFFGCDKRNATRGHLLLLRLQNVERQRASIQFPCPAAKGPARVLPLSASGLHRTTCFRFKRGRGNIPGGAGALQRIRDGNGSRGPYALIAEHDAPHIVQQLEEIR